MAQYTLPPISSIPSLSTEERAEVLSHLFEPCDALNTLVVSQLGSTTFAAYTDLISHVQNELLKLSESPSTSDTEWLLKILSAHPRLGAKKVDSAHSRGEQASLGGPTEAAELERLNNEYEEKFPGMRFVVFVAGRSRQAIMNDMETRIARGDIEAEKLEAINAMAAIANDRAKKLMQFE
ncbi:hypothetical protein TWF730_000673 [Orbilia blumenaviensis]|uniref:Oxo-4-hydroxy-4-carboxy-5-ureidoimidazoline decarboxylase domain-containing protein n=1 Tax=Orbilia blumenaviensis TaxID=1796055 RepID=A0AAV9VMC8_9PEZI